MRYLVALIIGIAVLFGVNYFADLFSMSRPWGSLLMGSIVGITMVLILLTWEAIKPSHKGTVPAKPAMSDEERAEARAERRARLAAEAGVSLDGIDGSRQTPQSGDASATDSLSQPATSEPGESSEPAVSEDGVSPKSDESSIEAEPDDGQPNDDESGDTELDPAALAPDDSEEEATGSSLENPPTGEPGTSVDALEDAESADAGGGADASASGDESTTGDSDSKS